VAGSLSRTQETSFKPTDLTLVYQGDADHVAWTVDLHLDAEERPVAVFSVQHNGSSVQDQRSATGMDLRYY
jgi:hypothetical protein